MKTLHEFGPHWILTDMEKRAIYQLTREFPTIQFKIINNPPTYGYRVHYRIGENSPNGWGGLTTSTLRTFAYRAIQNEVDTFNFSSVIAEVV